MNIEVHHLHPNQYAHVRLLVVDRDQAFRSVLAQALEAGSYHVEQAADGRAALAHLTTTPCDGLIFDMDMLDLDGVAFMRKARKTQPELMIVTLTSRPTLESAIAAIQAGVADYLLKPVSIATVAESVVIAIEKQNAKKNQLMRLVRGILHTNNGQGPSLADSLETERHSSPEANPQIIIVSPFRLDQSKRLITMTDDPTRTIKLTRGEATVLTSLMTSPGQLLSCQQLARSAWQYDLDPDEAGHLIRPYIFRLRRKLEDDPKEPQFIITMHGQGYLFASQHSGLSNT
jgi:DNA-binding response OmpR family regulator